MGSLIGGLLTKKKRKKLNRQLNAEYKITADAQKEAQRIEQLQANYGVRQEKIAQLREARIRRAAIIASGYNAGTTAESSSVQGGASSAYSSALANYSNLNVLQGYSGEISKQNIIAAESQSRQQVLQGKLQTQQEKAQMIGSAFDTAFTIATLPWGGISGATSAALNTARGVSLVGTQLPAPITSLT